MSKVDVVPTIAFANQKGGTGKSTLTANVAAAAGERGLRVLVVDVDPQADATSMLGIDSYEQPRSLFDVMTGACELPAAVVASASLGVDVVVGHERMADVELSLGGEMMRERFLSQALEGHVAPYDVVLVDCPPNLGLLTVNALVACQQVIGVVSMVDRNAYKGVLALMQTIKLLQGHGVPVELTGIARTQVSRDRLAYRALEEEMRRAGLPLLATEVPLAAIFHNAGVAAKPLVLFAPQHSATQSVRELSDELLAGVRARSAA